MLGAKDETKEREDDMFAEYTFRPDPFDGIVLVLALAVVILAMLMTGVL